MARNKKTPDPQPSDIHVGDRVVITGKRSISGQEGTVAEIDTAKNKVRLMEWGAPLRARFGANNWGRNAKLP
jgi:hypothetical protein